MPNDPGQRERTAETTLVVGVLIAAFAGICAFSQSSNASEKPGSDWRMAATVITGAEAGAPFVAQVPRRRLPATPRAGSADDAVFRYTIDAVDADFGPCEPGTVREIRDAIVVHVFSGSSWVLKAVAGGPSATTASQGGFLPMSCLSWRSGSSVYQSFRDAVPVTLATGPPTGSAGAEIRVDLRLTITDTDPIGRLALNLAIQLEPR